MIIALAGNPNCGKTTLFNSLTGSTAHVGNWPGVTVEHKEGFYRVKETKEKHSIIDLPGIYSLTPYTPEEVVARNYLLAQKPDVIINIVDATNLERNLYLTTQILEIDCPVVIALNMMDVVEKNKGKIDIQMLSEKLGVPVVSISALKGAGKDELMQIVLKQTAPRLGTSVLEKSVLKKEFAEIANLYEAENKDNIKFRTVKILEGDSIEVKNNPQIALKVTELTKGLEIAEEFENDFEAIIADQRYRYITDNFEIAVKEKPKITLSDKIDKVLTNRWAGIPIFLAIMFVVFHLVFTENFLGLAIFGVNGGEGIMGPGVAMQTLLGWGTGSFIDFIRNAMLSAPSWATGLICDGLLGGLDAVLSFLPQILLLFVFLAILEDSGYMARVAFIMDRAFRKFGLSGKAFMPLIMCFGCAVPGIMATRSLASEKERKIAIFVSPFFSCGAKLPIWAAVTSICFPNYAVFAVFGIYLLGIGTAILAAFILGKTILKGETPPFIMELPAYHMPLIRNVLVQLWDKLKHYIIRAATIIAGASVVIWFLSSFSFTFQYVESASETSILGVIGGGLRYLFVPLGFGSGSNGWKFTVAIFTGLIAKEMVVGTLGVLGGDGDGVVDDGLIGAGLGAMLATLSGPAAFAFMAFNLLSVPCMAAVSAANAEFVKKSDTFKAIAFWLITAYVVSLVCYWVGMMFTTGSPIGIAVFTLALLLVAFTVVYNIYKKKKNKKNGLPCGGNCDGCKDGCLKP